VDERGFTRDAIAFEKEGKLLNGRNIYERALTVVKNCKMATKFHDDYQNPDGTNRSGKATEDVLMHVRQKMFVYLKGAVNSKSNSRKKEEEKALTEDDMPPRWLFNGWFAFVLFGPQGISTQRLSCLSKDGKDVPKASRAVVKAKEAEAKCATRRADDSGTRGMSVQDQLTLATCLIARNEKKQQMSESSCSWPTVKRPMHLARSS
jgi:hypothetical protein